MYNEDRWKRYESIVFGYEYRSVTMARLNRKIVSEIFLVWLVFPHALWYKLHKTQLCICDSPWWTSHYSQLCTLSIIYFFSFLQDNILILVLELVSLVSLSDIWVEGLLLLHANRILLPSLSRAWYVQLWLLPKDIFLSFSNFFIYFFAVLKIPLLNLSSMEEFCKDFVDFALIYPLFFKLLVVIQQCYQFIQKFK